MAQIPVVKIEGSELKGVVSVSYGVGNGISADGQPANQKYQLGIRIVRHCDDCKDISDWGKACGEARRKKGTIDFYKDEDKKKMKTLAWEKGYVKDYKVRYDPQMKKIVEDFVVFAEKIKVGEKEIDYEWEVGP